LRQVRNAVNLQKNGTGKFRMSALKGKDAEIVINFTSISSTHKKLKQNKKCTITFL